MGFSSDLIMTETGGRSGRAMSTSDFYAGMMLYGTAPTVTGRWPDYTGNNPTIKAEQIFSPDDAETLGIVGYTENTAATGNYAITVAGTSGDTLELKVTIPLKNNGTRVVSLGVYTVGASDTTIALQCTAARAVINAGTINHGFSAAGSSPNIALTAPKITGVSLNTATTPISATIVGATLAGTITQFSGGTASLYALWRYQINEFFRKFPDGNLYIGIISASSSFNELLSLQTVANKKLRQIFVYDHDATRSSAANVSASILQIETAVATLKADCSDFVCVYTPNIAAVSNLATYPDQNLNTGKLVRCVISQDGDAAGAQLYVENGKTVGNGGVCLATIAASRVSASDAQAIPAFILTDGVENNVPAFGNGILSKNITAALQYQLDAYNYTFFRTFGSDVAGTYWNDNKTCITRSSDFCNVNDNRTIQKIKRIARAVLIPELNSELIFNEDGTLSDFTIEFFKDLLQDAVTANMITGYGSFPLISAFSPSIDPTQPVKSTQNLIINGTVTQNGIARKITFNVSY